MMPTDCLLAFFAIFYFLLLLYRSRRKPNLPPGPSGLPIVGSYFQVPKIGSHYKYLEWGLKFGPIIHFRLFSQDVIVLNSFDVASALLNKHSTNYADRPRQVMAGELVGWDRALAITPAGPRHRSHRKLINGVLSATAVKRLEPVQEEAARQFVLALASGNHNFLDILRNIITKSLVGVIFGESDEGHGGMTASDIEKYIQDQDEANRVFFKTTTPFAYLVDSLPWLRYVPEFLPFAGFKREARLARQQLDELTFKPYAKTRSRIDAGHTLPSYIDLCLSTNPNVTQEEEDSIAWTANSAFGGGTDTTISTVSSILLFAALHPDKQRLVYEELSNVVGSDRLPTLADKPNLPYTTAFIQECMRMAPAAPAAVPHKAVEADFYEGYLIPKGTVVIPNVWAMIHDPNLYPDPWTFDPTRFLPHEGITTIPSQGTLTGRNEPSADSIIFGFGRRVCPGMFLASSGVWIYSACFFSMFEIELQEGDRGKTLDDFKFVEHLLRYPMPFDAQLKVREGATDLLKRES